MFFQHWCTIFPGNRYPQVSTVTQVFRIPHVCHEYIVGTMEHFLLCCSFYLIYKGTLSAEGLVGTLTTAWIRQLFPRTIDILRLEHAGCIRRPTGTSAGNHPVDAILLEDGRSLILSTCCHTNIAAVVLHVVIRQLCDLER